MKYFCICAIVIFFTTTNVAQRFEKDSTAIRNVLTDFFEVFTNPDIKYFDKNCDQNFELLEHGEVWRRPEIKAYVDQALSEPKSYIRTNSFDFIKVNIHKNFAWVDYWNTAKKIFAYFYIIVFAVVSAMMAR
jgi:hypothetical protein